MRTSIYAAYGCHAVADYWEPEFPADLILSIARRDAGVRRPKSQDAIGTQYVAACRLWSSDVTGSDHNPRTQLDRPTSTSMLPSRKRATVL